MYLYRATKDETVLQMGADLVASIQHTARTECGYATVRYPLRNMRIYGKYVNFRFTIVVDCSYLNISN